jgi:peptide/nickel transport system ATP-binding protein
VLSAAGVVAGYRSGQPVLDGVDLNVAAGEVVGLAGPSGCGKSTLARVLALLLPPWAGEIRLDGEPVRRFRHAAPRGHALPSPWCSSSPAFPWTPGFRLREVIATAPPAGVRVRVSSSTSWLRPSTSPPSCSTAARTR